MVKAICIVPRDVYMPVREGGKEVYRIETVYLVVTVEGAREAVEDLVQDIKMRLGYGIECAVIG